MESLVNGHRHWLLDRRQSLKLAGLAGLSWMTPLGQLLAQQAQAKPGRPARSLILLWMAGGPSQLETFDPHPGKEIAGGTKAIKTNVPGIQLASGFEPLAEQADRLAIVRSVVSKEGDHERGTYNVKNGYRPDPTAVHPSIGAILCHELPLGVPELNIARTEIPRHVSILPNQWPGRGGFLGDQYDAFKTFDPASKVPDVTARVPDDRFANRLADLNVVEKSFARGRMQRVERTRHVETVSDARTMMTTEQLAAFEVERESAKLREAYGDTGFGRGCLAARRLVEVGVRCVEVTLNGWDSHVNNHATQAERVKELAPAFSTLLSDLEERGLLDDTVVVCCGEFGRTPKINGVEGRDHWPHGFSVVLAGGGIRGGQVIGATDPEGGREVEAPVSVGDVHASVLHACGIDHTKENISRVNRPIRLAEGEPIPALFG